jgi:hypothetical protein
MTMKALHHDQPNPTDGARLCFVVLTTKHTNLAPVPSHPRSDAGRTCVVKATESDSSLTDSLTDSGTEGARLCFVVLTTKAYESASCPALPRQTKETNLPSWLPPPRQTNGTNLPSAAPPPPEPLADEGIRICFVWPAYEGDESGFLDAAPKADEGDESGFVAADPEADEGDESAFGRRSPV